MTLVPAKCTNCGGTLEVDSMKEAAICPHCGSAFIVEKAINNYNTTYHVNNDIHDSVVNLYETKELTAEEYLEKALSYVKIEEFDDAKICYKEARRLEPENINIIQRYSTELFNRGILFLKNNNIKQGNNLINEAFSIELNNGKYCFYSILFSTSDNYCSMYIEAYPKIMKWERDIFEVFNNDTTTDLLCNLKIKYFYIFFNERDIERCNFILREYFNDNLSNLKYSNNNLKNMKLPVYYAPSIMCEEHNVWDECTSIDVMKIIFSIDRNDLFNPFEKKFRRRENFISLYQYAYGDASGGRDFYSLRNGECYPEMLELIGDFYTIPDKVENERKKFERKLKSRNICRYCFGELNLFKKCKRCGRQN